MSPSTNSKKLYYLLFLFALPFTLIGIFKGWQLVTTIWEWKEIQNWVETPAEILATKLEVHRGKNSVSYLATASYTYDFKGEHHVATRVSLHSSGDDIMGFQKQVGKELQQFFSVKQPFRCYVNPDQTNEAILYRDFRPFKMVMAGIEMLLSGVFGMGVFAIALCSKRQFDSRQKLMLQFPDQPWMHRDDWATGMIYTPQRASLLIAWGFAVIWNLVSWCAAIQYFTSDEPWPMWIYLATIGFLLIGLAFFGYAIYLLLHYRKWGAPSFEMATVPGLLGGRLAGVIHVPRNMDLGDGLLVTLTCFKKKGQKYGNKNKWDSPLWQAEKRIIRAFSNSEDHATAIPINFYIPIEQFETDEEQGHFWKLESRAATPGIDFHAEFEVPIFGTEESSQNVPLSDDILIDYERQEDNP